MTGKAEDADALAPFKDSNVARRKAGRQDVLVFYCVHYNNCCNIYPVYMPLYRKYAF